MDFDKTIVDEFQRACAEYGDKPAFTALNYSLSFARLDALSAQFACYLQQHTNLVQGDRIALQLPNLLQYPVAVFGAFRAGLVVVNVNPLYTERELEHQLNDSGAKALVVLENVADTAAAVVPRTRVEQVITTQVGDIHPGFKKYLISAVVKYIKRQVPSVHFTSRISLPKALALGEGASPAPISTKPNDLAVLQYTGGTTGVAKGAMLSHRNLVANKEQAVKALGEDFEGGNNIFVAPLPLYHIYAYTIHCMAALCTGNHSLLIPNPRDIPGFVKTLGQTTPNIFVGLNTLFNALCHNEDFCKLDFSSWASVISGGMALNADTATRWQQVTGCEIREAYGLSETSPAVSATPRGRNQVGCVGLPMPETEIRILDTQGHPQPRGEPGELCVKGPQVMLGYWQKPEETAKVLSEDGWFRTGDIAVWQEDGYLKIVDRVKDMIIVSGFKVFPNEVEDVITQHPGVMEAAAIGVPDAESGEAVKLFLVVKDKSLGVDEIRGFCRERLAAYKVPAQVAFRDELPKSNVGKVLRKELRE